MDRHRIWRIVGNNYKGLLDRAPAGYAPVVEVFLVGRAEPVRLAQVQTTPDPAFPWALLVAETGPEDEARAQDERLVFVPDQYVQRVEVSYVRSDKTQLGFSHEALDDADSESSDS